MESQTTSLVLVLLSFISISLVACLPARDAEHVLQEASGLALDKRPKYMDTRRDLDVFKDLVLISIQELVDEGRLQNQVLPEEDQDGDEKAAGVEKRRYMGLCMRRQYNQFIPFPCLRSGR